MCGVENNNENTSVDEDGLPVELEYEDVILLRLLSEVFSLKAVFSRIPEYTRRKFRHLDAFETSTNVILAEMGYYNDRD